MSHRLFHCYPMALFCLETAGELRVVSSLSIFRFAQVKRLHLGVPFIVLAHLLEVLALLLLRLSRLHHSLHIRIISFN